MLDVLGVADAVEFVVVAPLFLSSCKIADARLAPKKPIEGDEIAVFTPQFTRPNTFVDAGDEAERIVGLVPALAA